MTDTHVRAPPSPYKGLANYTEDDAAFFFGRDREREVVIANLQARRLTLLYGASGVGKSSLLRAGVAAQLLDRAYEDADDLGTPEYVPVVFSNWRDDVVAGLSDAILRATTPFTSEPPPAASQRLDETIASAAERADARLLIILDQFEEYFLYHPAETGDRTFAAEFPRAVNHPGLPVGFLVSIREDALAKLDRFKRDIPRLFDTYLRVSHLDAAAAREAILRPVDEYNALVPADRRVTLEPALVGAVLDQVRTGQVVLEQAGRGTLERAESPAHEGDRIETPYLQLVMARLWAHERGSGSHKLQLATLAALGGAQEIVRTHLDGALRNLSDEERDAAADLFHHLVTPSGTKIAHSASDLAEYTGRPEPQIAALLATLSRQDTRIVRPVAPPPGEDGPPRFEIFHDVLAPSVLDWRARQTAARRAAAQRRAARAAVRRRLLMIGAGVGAVLIAALLALAILANSQRNEARTQESRARALAVDAGEQEQIARGLAAESERQAGRARRFAAKSRREERRARGLFAEARRQARRASRLAARASALAEENAANAARASALAAANARNAARARALAAAARRDAALFRQVAKFDASATFSWKRADDVSRLEKLSVTAQPGAVITVSCIRARCPTSRHTLGGTGEQTVSIPTVVNRSLPLGSHVRLLVRRGVVGKAYDFVSERQGVVMRLSDICRPAGSPVPASVVELACP